MILILLKNFNILLYNDDSDRSKSATRLKIIKLIYQFKQYIKYILLFFITLLLLLLLLLLFKNV